MEKLDKKRLAELVRKGRAARGYTQQEVADLTRVSLRSIQRIENGEVLPRVYTLRLLEECLGVALVAEGGGVEFHAADEGMGGEDETGVTASSSGSVGQRVELAKTAGWSRPRKWILSVGVGVLILLLTGAFLAQSARFPETDFERLLLWSGVLAVYVVVLLRIWK